MHATCVSLLNNASFQVVEELADSVVCKTTELWHLLSFVDTVGYDLL